MCCVPRPQICHRHFPLMTAGIVWDRRSLSQITVRWGPMILRRIPGIRIPYISQREIILRSGISMARIGCIQSCPSKEMKNGPFIVRILDWI